MKRSGNATNGRLPCGNTLKAVFFYIIGKFVELPCYIKGTTCQKAQSAWVRECLQTDA